MCLSSSSSRCFVRLYVRGESVECCGLYNYILEIKEEDKRDGKEKIEECKKDGVREIR